MLAFSPASAISSATVRLRPVLSSGTGQKTQERAFAIGMRQRERRNIEGCLPRRLHASSLRQRVHDRTYAAFLASNIADLRHPEFAQRPIHYVPQVGQIGYLPISKRWRHRRRHRDPLKLGGSKGRVRNHSDEKNGNGIAPTLTDCVRRMLLAHADADQQTFIKAAEEYAFEERKAQPSRRCKGH